MVAGPPEDASLHVQVFPEDRLILPKRQSCPWFARKLNRRLRRYCLPQWCPPTDFPPVIIGKFEDRTVDEEGGHERVDEQVLQQQSRQDGSQLSGRGESLKAQRNPRNV